MTNIAKKFEQISAMVNKTPLLEIRFNYKGQERIVYAKAEYYNLTGSIKDRVAYHIMKKSYENDEIKPDDIIVEATSGNTGISFCAMGSYLGHKVKIFMPNWMSSERINLIKSYGAEIVLVSKEEGGFLGSIAMANDEVEKNGAFCPYQFSNPYNTETHYLTTGEEIVNQLKKLGKTPDGVVAGVGTGGTIMGLIRRLKEENSNCMGFPMEPENSPTMSTGYKVGCHRIQGISDEFIPEIVKFDELNDIIAVDDGDAIIVAQMLSRKLGIGVGISSGANFIAAIKAQDIMGSKDKVVVTVFADDSKKYLTTDYSKELPVSDNFYSKDIEFLEVIAHRCD